jgi:hypothetical protein
LDTDRGGCNRYSDQTLHGRYRRPVPRRFSTSMRYSTRRSTTLSA